jgi:hypothetical protein
MKSGTVQPPYNLFERQIEYVLVENATSALADFTYSCFAKQANRFREAFTPAILQMEFRLAELENPLRQHGIQLGQVADRKTMVDELKRASLVMRARSYRRRLFSEFDRAREVFLPKRPMASKPTRLLSESLISGKGNTCFDELSGFHCGVMGIPSEEKNF